MYNVVHSLLMELERLLYDTWQTTCLAKNVIITRAACVLAPSAASNAANPGPGARELFDAGGRTLSR